MLITFRTYYKTTPPLSLNFDAFECCILVSLVIGVQPDSATNNFMTLCFHLPWSDASIGCVCLLIEILSYSGEIHLQASANRRAVRRHLKPESDKPEGMKVDGIFQSPGGLEMGFVEMSGGHQTNDQPRYLKDHVRGFRGQRDLLRC